MVVDAWPARAASSKSYRYSTSPQVVMDANSRLVVAVGLPLPGSRDDCRACTESGVDRACRGAPVIADGGFEGTGLLISSRRRRGRSHLSPSQEAENTVHRRDSEELGEEIAGAEFVQAEHGFQDSVGGGQLVLGPSAPGMEVLAFSLPELSLLT